MQSYHLEADRLRALAGGLLLEQVLKGREPQFTESGKPYLRGGPFFNISHSGDFAALAVSGASPVGIDIQLQQHKKKDLNGLSKCVYHSAELAFFLKNPTPSRFYDLWTLKESYVKMLGTGFSKAAKEYSVIPASGFDKSPERFSVCVQGEACFFQTFNFLQGYSLSVCSQKECEFSVGEYQNVTIHIHSEKQEF